MQNLTMQHLVTTLALLAGMSFCAVIAAGLIGQIFVPQKESQSVPLAKLNPGWKWSIVALSLALGIFGFALLNSQISYFNLKKLHSNYR